MDKYQKTFTNTAGDSLAAATIDVWVSGTNQSVRAMIWNSDDDTLPPKANPFQTNAKGVISFYAADGKVDVRGVSQSGLIYTDDDVTLFDAPPRFFALEQAESITEVNADLAIEAASAAEAAALRAQAFSQAAADAGQIFATTADALSNGVSALTISTPGTGAANGTFPLTFSGGSGSGAVGQIVVSGGVIVSAFILGRARGRGYTSAPAVTHGAGGTGVVTASIGINAPADTYFNVTPSTSGNDLIVDLYRNIAGVATLVAFVPLVRNAPGSPAIFEVLDAEGFVGFDVAALDGAIRSGALVIAPGVLTLGGLALAMNTNAGLTLKDGEGFCVDLVSLTGQPVGGASASTSAAADLATYGARDMRNIAESRQSVFRANAITTGISKAFNHIAAYGQSLQNGTFPVLSSVAYASNLMLGGSVHSTIDDGPSYSPVGGSATFQPLVGTVLDASGNVLSPAQVPAGSPASTRGESPLVAAGNLFKRLFNGRTHVEDDAGRKLVVTASGVNGKPIDQLQKGSAQGYWGKLTGHATAVKAAAGASSVGLAAMIFIQGEQDYSLSTGYTNYLARLTTLRTNWINDIHVGIYGGSAATPPPMFIVQAGGEFTQDINGRSDLCSIGQAQLDFANATPGVYLVGPYYQLTNLNDGTGHPDVNGYRWLGAQIAKVMDRVLTQRQDFKPLQPRGFTLAGNVLAVDFLVPVAPLVFDSPYIKYTPTDFANKGFYVIDATSEIDITGIRIVGQTIVEITLARAPAGDTYFAYVPRAANTGNGCLRDSDPMLSTDLYAYNAGTGQETAANVTALINKPHPLQNWCVAYNLKIQ